MADTHVHAANEHHHAHHFANADDEFEASKQGMWVFLVTEVLMFGGLFVAYAIFRGMYPEMFHEGAHHLDVKLGAINTVVLITSSVTMVLAVIATQKGRRDQAIIYLVLTFLLACAFLVVKYFEYTHKFHLGIGPGGMMDPKLYTGPDAMFKHQNITLFYSLYFMMTGLHGFHVIVGMGVIAWILKRTLSNEFGPNFYTPVELVGFYWHFVDLVWIYLFPLMYLVG